MANTSKPWLKNYPKGIPENINQETYTSLIEMFEDTFEKYKDLPAFDCMGKSLSFNQINRESRNFAA